MVAGQRFQAFVVAAQDFAEGPALASNFTGGISLLVKSRASAVWRRMFR
jgi:hypothetical protein